MLRKSTTVALKFFAISLLFQLILMLPTLLVLARNSLLGGDAGMPQGPLLLIIGIVSAGMGLLAIRGIVKVANAVSLEGIPSRQEGEALDLDQLLRYAIMVMGLFFAATAFFKFPIYVFNFLRLKGQFDGMMSFGPLVSLISVMLKMGLGYYLIANSKKTVKWLSSF